MANSHILTLTCPDRPGIVHAVSGAIFDGGGNILDSRQFDDAETGLFFLRMVFAAADAAPVRAVMAGLADDFALDWHLVPTGHRAKALILVSKFDHCLSDLLYRQRIGELAMEVVGVVGNHPSEVLALTNLRDIPYHHLPVTPATKSQQEAALKALVEASGAELVILARYMQVLSDDLVSWLAGRCINIHHSFLPGFKGAKPYHQAHARGVKMIGATAHYVTSALDEGPIIHQDVEPVSHADDPEDLIRKGRDIERRVLAGAVAWHLERRVFINGTKTVVFAD
jgi:formyltetrahydrofolate deformylase